MRCFRPAARLLPVGDVAGMAEAGLELISDSRRWHAASTAARAAAERFGADDIVGRYEAFYERVLSQ